jgi:hypothetical protein
VGISGGIIMSGPDYTTTFTVDKTPQEAYESIMDPRGWWSEGIVGVTDEVGGEFVHSYLDVHRCTVRVTELVPGRTVRWLVVDNYFDFIHDQAEWKDTEILFDISETSSGAEIRFTHVGLVPAYECYDVCSNAWAGYLDGSLRSLIATGTGHPNPKDDAGLPDHQSTATGVREVRRDVRLPA